MANPQPTDAHLRVAHQINEQIMASDFTKRQRKILDLILRLSWGCNKKEAHIPKQKDFEVVGVGESHIKAELRWLELAKVITISGNQYSFNKDYDEWRVSRAKGYDPEKLTELVRINLSHNPKTYQNSKANLPKQEDTAYQNSKNSTSKLATAKEILKKGKEKELPMGFTALRGELNKSTNKVGFLVTIFKNLHSHAPPEDFEDIGGRIAGILKLISNDHGYLLKLIWQTAAADIAGSHLNYISGIVRKMHRDIATEYADSGHYKPLGNKRE